MATPLYAYVINTGKMPYTLQDGHNNSVDVRPGSSQSAVRVGVEFTTWAPMPGPVKILRYELSDGTLVNKLPTDGPTPDSNQL